METKRLKVSEIKNNPDNPRIIKDDKFKKLVKSIKEFPEMMEAREIVVNKDHIILGGNMRFKAAKEAGLADVPVKIVDWSEEKQREFVIKDNVSGGEWDWEAMANQYEFEELDSWGVDLPKEMSTREKKPTISVRFDDVGSMEEAMLEISNVAELYGGETRTNM